MAQRPQKKLFSRKNPAASAVQANKKSTIKMSKLCVILFPKGAKLFQGGLSAPAPLTSVSCVTPSKRLGKSPFCPTPDQPRADE
jgi:hypothetical protein